MKKKTIDLEIFVDGACSGNPGDSGCGIVIQDACGLRQEKISRYLGTGTNNFAEYQALILALQRVKEIGAKNILVKSDSELLVKQLNGEYQIKNENLKGLYAQAVTLRENFPQFELRHIRRELNAEADALAKNAITRYRRANQMTASQDSCGEESPSSIGQRSG